MSSEASAEPVLVERAEGVATLTLTGPSLTAQAKDALRTQLQDVAADSAIRAVVLTGSGKIFCAGQDLGEHARALESGSAAAFETLARDYEPIVTTLLMMPKPVVAAVNGTCVGAGLSLALACDLRLARSTATFATAFTAIGLSFDSGLSATLARAIGTARASELMLLGSRISAETALAWGLVGTVVEEADWDGTVREVAGRLATGPTQAYVAVKRAIAAAWSASLPDVFDAERAAQIDLGGTADHRAAVAAFLAKRRPTFDGRPP